MYEDAYCILATLTFTSGHLPNVVQTPDSHQVCDRSYPWGVIEVDNEEHCDFVKLCQMHVHTYMEELREYMNDVLYENWRTEKLLSMGVTPRLEYTPRVGGRVFYYLHSSPLLLVCHLVLLLAYIVIFISSFHSLYCPQARLVA
jgi:hypothetical protein